MTTNEFQPRNVGSAQVLGVELELRRNFPIGTHRLNFSSNLTLAHSSLEMSQQEFDSRLSLAKAGQTISNTRNMAGQAPIILNAGLSYANEANTLDFGLYYNVKGRTLEVVGGGLFPDVYSVPFHSLNLSANHSFGEGDKIKVGLTVDNLLTSTRESVFGSFNAQDQIFSRLNPGTAIGLSLSYSLL